MEVSRECNERQQRETCRKKKKIDTERVDRESDRQTDRKTITGLVIGGPLLALVLSLRSALRGSGGGVFELEHVVVDELEHEAEVLRERENDARGMRHEATRPRQRCTHCRQEAGGVE